MWLQVQALALALTSLSSAVKALPGWVYSQSAYCVQKVAPSQGLCLSMDHKAGHKLKSH